MLGVCVRVCLSAEPRLHACRISLGGEGNALYPVLVSSLMYGLDACYLSNSQLNSLDFVINRVFIKTFKTNNIDIVKYCQSCFDFEMPSDLWVASFDDLRIFWLPVCQPVFIYYYCLFK